MVTLESDYDPNSNGAITIRVTNTLDEATDNESIGYSEMNFEYDFDPSVEWTPVFTGNYDEGVANPTALWENNCDASEKTCQGHQYFGGFNECAQGHSFWRVF
jgi:hypothetical protein